MTGWAVDVLIVTEFETKTWGTVCELTEAAMAALVTVEQSLMAVDGDSLTPLEFRTLLWVRCSLASLYGVRADDALSGPLALLESLDADWLSSLAAD